jgi:hypothetical protein
MSTRALARLAIAAIALVGCARIESYQVTPLHVCAGDPVTVRWRAEGDVRLTSAPPLESVGLGGGAKVGGEGTMSIRVPRSVRLTLTASRPFREQHVEADVVVAQGSPARPFGGLGRCDEAAHAAEASFALGDNDVAPGAHAAVVSNPTARPLIVIHRDRTDTIPAGGTSRRFADRAAAGPWVVRMPTGAAESCDSALAAQADRLTVNIQLDCGG